MQVILRGLEPETWKRLGVGGASVEVPLPRPSRVRGFVKPPEGVRVWEGHSVRVPRLSSGLGEEAARFIRKYRHNVVSVEAGAGEKPKAAIRVDGVLGAREDRVEEYFIHARQDSALTLVFDHQSPDNWAGLSAQNTWILAEKDASVRVITIQRLGEGGLFIDNIGAKALEGASVEVVHILLGAGRAYAGAEVALEGDESRTDMASLYFTQNHNEADFHYIARHIGRDTKSDILTRGALADQSRKVFRAAIDFQRGCKGAKGREDEYALLLDKGARSRTAPLILCGEEDVSGEHAASAGRLDEEKLFYLKTRGLDDKQARRILLEAQFEPVIARIALPALEKAVREGIQRKWQDHV